jgi:hypothetical protein
MEMAILTGCAEMTALPMAATRLRIPGRLQNNLQAERRRTAGTHACPV